MTMGAQPAQAWKEWEGQLIDGKYPLLRFLGGRDSTAVFLTERPEGDPAKTAIKLFLADDTIAEAQLARWSAAARLSHPHLLRLFEMGRARLGDHPCAYVLMEYAEENLSQVGRPLTTEEASDMLEGVLPALAYLHGKQLAHGHLKPSNILATDDQLKLSSDTIRPTGEWSRNLDVQDRCGPPEILVEGASPAGDIWSLGITLVDALTKHPPAWEPGAFRPSLPNDLPSVFHVPASNCLRPDPQQRWTAADFVNFLHGNVETPPSSPNKPPRAPMALRRNLLLAGVAVSALAAIAILPRFVGHRVPPAAPAVQPQDFQPETVAPPPASPDPPPKMAAPKPPTSAAGQEILKQILPDVPAKARNTISGKVRINVRVDVDASGSVVNAHNDSPASSRFFGNLALESARRWKFAPADPSPSAHPREWALRFEFVRDPRRPVSVQAVPVR